MTEVLLPSPHPLTPPRSEEDWVAWFRLLRSRRVGPTTFHRLMAEHGSAQAALDVLPEVARAAGVKDYTICPEAVAVDEIHQGRLAGAKPIPFGSDAYPALLAELPDAPPILWALGRIELLRAPKLALVGARNASSLGTRMARALAEALGQKGFVIASGLARGIDTAAHMASLSTGTIAVCGGGVDVVYPAENAVLAQEIAEHGLRLSEQPMGMQPMARHFPARNRIISGLCQALVVVEAAAKSGSLLTAKNALDQGRDVFAVPGHPFDARAAGCNMLLRDGATLIRSAQDVVDALPSGFAAQDAHDAQDADGPAQVSANAPSAPRAARSSDSPPDPSAAARMAGDHGPSRSFAETRALHTRILERLGPSPVAEDQLIRDLELAAKQVVPEIVTLELEGKILRQAGGLLSRA